MSRALARGLAVLLMSGATVADAAAQEPGGRPAKPHAVAPDGDDPVYPAAFYAPFQPQTALDMLERTPGFTLVEGSFVRGFGGAGGNALIDGQRPTVKLGGIAEVLRRIPAARVKRIVLLRGGDAAQAQGQMLVANVILKADAAGSGTATLGLARTSDGLISPSGRVSYARGLAGWQASIELSGEVARYPSHARYRVRDSGGVLVQTGNEQASGEAPEIGLAASASRPLAGGALTLNARLGYDGYASRRVVVLHAGDFEAPAVGRRDIAYDETGHFAELGADWTRPLGGDWALKLVGIGRLERYRTDEDYAEAGYRGVSALHQKPAEAVARATFSREGDHWLRPEVGAEVAWNALTSRLDYAEDLGSGLTLVTLSGADTRVTEMRGEAFANLKARLGATFSAEAGAAFEFSRIRVTGDASSSQSLSYLKPSATLIWSPASSTEIRLGVRRTVGQLDFGDFAASVDQADGRPLGGNAALRPTRLTRGFLRLDHRWSGGGALSAELFHQRHDGLLGYVLLPSGDQALGAIGDGREWGMTAQVALPLNGIVPGAQVKVDGTLRRARVRDPITGRTRQIDELPDSALSAEFRHDVPVLKSAWGVRYTAAETTRTFYVGEAVYSRARPIWSAYAETTAIRGFKAVLTIEGLSGQDSHRLRRFHALSRAGAFIGDESRDQRQGAAASFTLTRAL